jgi:rhomboid family GlyGly-CTERM serine protease
VKLADIVRQPVAKATIVIAAFGLLFLVIGDPARELFRYDREAVFAGEVWRLLTAHLVHLGAGHTALNLVALILVFWLLGKEFTLGQWAWVSGFAIAMIGIGFVWLRPELQWYVGLSGLLHGWLAAGATQRLRQGHKDGLILLGAVLLKGFYEQLAGPLPGSEMASGGPVVVDAHWFGIVGGLLGVWSLRLHNRLTRV